MTDIVARVEEVKREPRPTLYIKLWPSNKATGHWYTDNAIKERPEIDTEREPAETLIASIPGEEEAARAAAIEKARQDVIDAAKKWQISLPSDESLATVEEYEVQLVDLRWDSARLQARALVHSSIKDRLQIQRAVLMDLIAQALTTSAKEPPHG